MATKSDYVINPDRFQGFFTALETRKTLLTTITDVHKNLIDHFINLEQSLSQKSQTLDSQIEAFSARSKKSLEALDVRETAIPEREYAAAARIEEQKAAAISDIENMDNNSESVEEKGLPELLRMYLRRMDSSGLVRLLLAKRKESVALRTEIAAALEEAVDPLRLVLDAVEDFLEMKGEGKVGLADRRWACGMFIQVAVPVPVEGKYEGGVATSLRERAAGLLEKWKGMLGGGEGNGGVGAAEATMFLQMVIGFRLLDKFQEDFLRKLVLEFATRRDMAKLAVALGFGDKMKDIIDELVKSGKEVEAVYFACESGLTEQFPPVALLKTCLRNCRKHPNTKSKNLPTVDETSNSELNATRAIIKCVEDHKLESQFTLDSLKRRVAQLEKAKADKKKNTASTSKPSNKRAYGGSGRGGGSGAPSFRPPKAARFSNPSPAFRHRTAPQLHQPLAARYSSPYSYPSPSVYEAPATASYGPGYGAHAQSPVGLSQQYPYGAQDVGVGAARAGGSYIGQGSYGGQSNYSPYDYNAAAPTYPPSYAQ